MPCGGRREQQATTPGTVSCAEWAGHSDGGARAGFGLCCCPVPEFLPDTRPRCFWSRYQMPGWPCSGRGRGRNVGAGAGAGVMQFRPIHSAQLLFAPRGQTHLPWLQLEMKLNNLRERAGRSAVACEAAAARSCIGRPFLLCFLFGGMRPPCSGGVAARRHALCRESINY